MVNTDAVREIAIVSAPQRRTRRAGIKSIRFNRTSRRTTTGFSITIPKVASADRISPISIAANGFTIRNTSTAPPSELRESGVRLNRNAPKYSIIMMPERTTEGVKLVSAMKNSTNPTVRAAAIRLPSRERRKMLNTAIAQTLMCSPETASRWEIPICRKSCVASAVTPDLSPSKRPFSRPPVSLLRLLRT